MIDKNLRLYGGFIGSECLLTEQGDPAEHPSVLSGDLNGDDVPDNFVTNRADNVMTVVTVTAAVTNETLVNGFTISNGQADGSQNNHQQNGGAVYSTGSSHLRQCSFNQNYAIRSGGAISQNSNFGQSLVLENCSFEKYGEN
ncbi:MAG: hypothetical protein IPM82_08165 [Saprospiraceae bacterium]|nr:hypothetical protein [Saprospiraceae bacterium]